MTLSFLMIFTYLLHAQSDVHIVKLNITNPLIRGLKCVEVIDKRIATENIGFAQKGMMNRKVAVQLEGPFNTYLKENINKIFFDEENPKELVFIFHELNVAERTTAFSEVGFCRMDIEFAEYRGEELYSLGRFDYEIEKGGMSDVTKKHADRIVGCLQKCIVAFYQSDWKNVEDKLINFNEEKKETLNTYNYHKIPKKGVYASFSKLGKEEPIEDVNFRVVKIPDFPKLERYKIVGMDKKEARKVMFISDGENIYIHSTRYCALNHFTKSKHLGKYIYFEDRYSDPGATMALGLLGAAASNTLRGIVLDTTTGLTSILKQDSLIILLLEHPIILDDYNKSKGKLADRRKALVQLNRKLSEQE